MRAVLQLDVGTPESAWDVCAELAPFDLTEIERAVVIAPHPDDEVLALGGVMQLLAQRGCELSIVAVTDGEASHPLALHLTKSQLAELRAREREVALGRLGLGAAARSHADTLLALGRIHCETTPTHVRVTRLRCPDGGVMRETLLGDWLEPLVANATHCFAPWELDGHADHDASGRAAAIACARTETTLVRYPVWAWHWATPGELPWTEARRIDLDDAAIAAKHDAIAAYHSQIAPLDSAPVVLPPDVLARFRRRFEVVFV
jgi:LmbE family N-acetylglucosaminyl deacetylase